MTDLEDGGPAFPFILQGPRIEGDSHGMSLRDYFAGQALLGQSGEFVSDTMEDHKRIARIAYLLADAMLAERSQTTKSSA